VTKEKRRLNHEEAESDRAGGEGDSSRAHGIPHGDWYNELYGLWAVLKNLSPAKFGGGFVVL
jgi:hypothetical protein